MFPGRIKQNPRILLLTLLITFISGANFFVSLMDIIPIAETLRGFCLGHLLIYPFIFAVGIDVLADTSVQRLWPRPSSSWPTDLRTWYVDHARRMHHSLAVECLPRKEQGAHDLLVRHHDSRNCCFGLCHTIQQ